MLGFIIFAILCTIAIVVVIYFCNTYNKLILLRNDIKNDWFTLNEDIKYRVQLLETFTPVVDKYLDDETRDTARRIVTSYDILVSPEDIINLYITMEDVINKFQAIVQQHGINVPEWDIAFNNNKNSIVNKRLIYNDHALKFNAILLDPKSSFVGKIGKLTTFTYFRSEE